MSPTAWGVAGGIPLGLYPRRAGDPQTTVWSHGGLVQRRLAPCHRMVELRGKTGQPADANKKPPVIDRGLREFQFSYFGSSDEPAATSSGVGGAGGGSLAVASKTSFFSPSTSLTRTVMVSLPWNVAAEQFLGQRVFEHGARWPDAAAGRRTPGSCPSRSAAPWPRRSGPASGSFPSAASTTLASSMSMMCFRSSLGQAAEDDDVVHAVEELGPEVPLHLLLERLLHLLVGRLVVLLARSRSASCR